MSNQYQTIETLSLVSNPKQAEQVADSLRHSGIPTHQYWVEDSYSFAENLARRSWDLVIIAVDDDQQHIPACILRYPDIPFLAITQKNKSALVDHLLEHGITDVASFSRPARLKHALGRALTDASMRRENRLIRKHSEEHASLLKNLLQSSDEPIAFLHQGLHSFVNPAYLVLAGFSDTHTASATPILDIIDPAQQPALKQLLKDFSESRVFHSRLPVRLQRADGQRHDVVLDMSVARFEGEPVVQIIARSATAQSIVAETGQTSAPEVLSIRSGSESNPEKATTAKKLRASNARPAHNKARNKPVKTKSRDWNQRSSAGRKFNQRHSASPKRVATEEQNIASNVMAQISARTSHAQTESQTNELLLEQTLKLPPYNEIYNAEICAADDNWTRRISAILNTSEVRISIRSINSLRVDMYERYQLNLALQPKADGINSLELFLAETRRHQLLDGVDRWLLYNAASELAKQLRHRPGTRFFVALHADHRTLENLVPWLSHLIEKFRLPAGSLNLMLDGGGLTDNTQLCQKTIKQLKNLNIGVGLCGLNSELNQSHGNDPDQTIGFELLEALPLDFALLDAAFSDQIADVNARDSLQRLLQRCQAASITTMVETNSSQSLSAIWKMGADCFIGEPGKTADVNDFDDLDLTAAIQFPVASL